MDTQNILSENDRERSRICRKQKHAYAHCDSKASKYNKRLPSAFNVKDQKCLRDDGWILSYKDVELICNLECVKFNKYIPTRVIQRFSKCDFSLYYGEPIDKKIKRVAALMKNIQCLKLSVIRLPRYNELLSNYHPYFRYISFFKKQFSIRSSGHDELLLCCEPYQLTSLSTVSKTFNVSNHISNIMKLIPLKINSAMISNAVCLRLSNITHLTIELSEKDVSTQLVDSLGLLENLQSLEIKLSDTEALVTFLELFRSDCLQATKTLRAFSRFQFQFEEFWVLCGFNGF